MPAASSNEDKTDVFHTWTLSSASAIWISSAWWINCSPQNLVAAGHLRRGGVRMWNSVSWWGETMKLTAEFLQNVSAKFRDFLKEFWIFEVCNIKSIKISDILWNSGKNPWKSRRKITDLRRFQQNFAKNLENSLNFCKILQEKTANFEIWAVRRNE